MEAISSRNSVYDFNKSVPFTKKRPRKPETGNVTDVRKGKGREFGRETAGEGEGRRGTPARTLLFVRLSHFLNCFLYLHLFPASIFC